MKFSLYLFACILILSVNNIYSQLSWKDSLAYIDEDTSKLNWLRDSHGRLIYTAPDECEDINLVYDSIAAIVGNEKYASISENMKGMVHYVRSDFGNAIDHFLDAVHYFEQNGNSTQLARVYNNIATCYQNRSDNKKSTEYFEKALSIYVQLKDSIWIGNIHSNLALQYSNDQLYEKAQFHIDNAVPMIEAVGHPIYLGIALLNRANIHIHYERFNDAIIDYNKSMELVPEATVPLLHAASLSGIGVALNRQGQYRSAESYLKRGLEKAKAINSLEQIRESHNELSVLYENTAEWEKSLIAHKAYTAAKDSSFTLEQDAKLVDALSKYESEKKQQEIELLNTQNLLKETQLRTGRNRTIALTLGLVLLASLLLGMFRLYKKTQNQNEIISKTLNEKDTLLKEIHHRVKNNLQVISALLTLQSSHLKDSQAKMALQEGQGRVQSMALIHRDLYQHDNLKGVNTKEYLEQLTSNLVQSYKLNNDIDLNLDIEEIILDVDTMIPLGLLVNELISNALKHAYDHMENGELSITLKEENQRLCLNIKDNGKGISPEDLTKKASFGYSLIQSFANKLNAEIKFTNDTGTNVEIIISNYQKST